MLRDSIYKQKSAQKLVADPFAEEKHWLPACEAMRTNLVPSHVEKLRFSGIFLVCLLASAAMSLLLTNVVDFGYNWGYRLVEHFWGQPSGAHQGEVAIKSLAFVIEPLMFGLAYGAFKQHFGARSKLSLCLPVALALIVTVAWEAPAHLNDPLDFPWARFAVDVTLSAAMAVFSVVAGLFAGQRLYSELKKRTRAAQLFFAAALALLPLAVIDSEQREFFVPVQIACYFGSIALRAGFAAYLAKARDKTAAFITAGFALFPLCLANFLNVGGNLVSMFLDTFGWGASLGWRALASAAALSVVSMCAIATGSTVGWILCRRLGGSFQGSFISDSMHRRQ